MSTSTRVSRPSTTTTTVDQTVTDAALAAAAAPTSADAPGWTVEKRCSGILIATPTSEADVCASLSTIPRAGDLPGSYTSFDGRPGSTMSVIVTIYPNRAESETVFSEDTAPSVPSASASRLAVDQTSLYHVHVVGSSGSFVAAPEVGDRSAALRLRIVSDRLTVTEDWVYILRGRALVLCISAPPLNTDFQTQVLRTVVDRLTFGNIAATP